MSERADDEHGVEAGAPPKPKKRKGSTAAQSMGGVLFGFEQQIWRTAPPPQEMVHHARPDAPVPAGDGTFLTITMPTDLRASYAETDAAAEAEDDAAEGDDDASDDAAEGEDDASDDAAEAEDDAAEGDDDAADDASAAEHHPVHEEHLR
jgi:hypothetical protein